VAYRDEYDRAFVRRANEELTQVLAHDSSPVIVTGVTRNLSLWDELSTNQSHIQSHIAGTLDGSYESASTHDLGPLVWPVMQEFMARSRTQVLGNLGEAISSNQYAAGIDEVWTMAHEGRGQTLLVEEDFHYAGQLDSNGQLVPAPEGATGDGIIGDAVDDLIETVLNNRGRVVFVDNGSLETHNRIALTLRF
jgi:hypothetical protein